MHFIRVPILTTKLVNTIMKLKEETTPLKTKGTFWRSYIILPNQPFSVPSQPSLWEVVSLGGDKILAPTKYWRQQNIGADKILTPTKYWRRQNIGANRNYWRQQNSRVDKNPATTKLSHRQKSCVDKNLALTKILRWQKSCVDKNLVSTKILRHQNVGTDAEGSPYCLARKSPQLLTSRRPRWRSS